MFSMENPIVTAIALILVVHIVSRVLSTVTNLKPSLPEICASWNKNYVMEITLFCSVIVLHYGYQRFANYRMGGNLLPTL